MALTCVLPVLVNKRALEAGTELCVTRPPKAAKVAPKQPPKAIDLRKEIRKTTPARSES